MRVARRTLTCAAVFAIFVGCATKHTYTGKVVDSRGRPVSKAIVLGYWHAGPSSSGVTGGPVNSDGSFSLQASTRLQEITAVSSDEKHRVTLKNPASTGNVIVLPKT